MSQMPVNRPYPGRNYDIPNARKNTVSWKKLRYPKCPKIDRIQEEIAKKTDGHSVLSINPISFKLAPAYVSDLDVFFAYVSDDSQNFLINILLNENRKIVFANVSEYCASFGTKDPIWTLLRMGVFILHVVK